ncbi:MAG: hypothetical protein M3M85_01040 [bacterium]|nr:hypothetical protein [bacterium]
MREIEPSRIITPELGAETISAERALRVANIISDLEGRRLDNKQKKSAAIIGAAERSFDSAFDTKDIQSARLRGEEILNLITEQKTRSPHLDFYLNRALVLAQENLNPESLAAFADLTRAQIDSHTTKRKRHFVGHHTRHYTTKRR